MSNLKRNVILHAQIDFEIPELGEGAIAVTSWLKGSYSFCNAFILKKKQVCHTLEVLLFGIIR